MAVRSLAGRDKGMVSYASGASADENVADAKLFVASCDELLEVFKELYQRARDKKPYSSDERSSLGTALGDMVYGSPDKVSRAYSAMMSHYEHVLQEGFDYIIFAINDPITWQELLSVLRAFFLPEWTKRALRGDTFAEAACDDKNV